MLVESDLQCQGVGVQRCAALCAITIYISELNEFRGHCKLIGFTNTYLSNFKWTVFTNSLYIKFASGLYFVAIIDSGSQRP